MIFTHFNMTLHCRGHHDAPYIMVIHNFQVIEMPANNKTLVFVKKASGRLWNSKPSKFELFFSKIASVPLKSSTQDQIFPFHIFSYNIFLRFTFLSQHSYLCDATVHDIFRSTLHVIIVWTSQGHLYHEISFKSTRRSLNLVAANRRTA